MMLLQMSQEQMKLHNEELQEEIAQRKEAEEQKEKLHDQLLEASREAGMAEIASAVLHNVGNELNSINVASTLVSEQGRQTSLHHFFEIAELIRQHVDDFAEYVTHHPQGQLIPRALVELAQAVEPEYHYVMDEINHLTSGIDRIKQIIQAQQSYVTHVDVNQASDPAQIIEDALAINQAGIEQREIIIQKHLPQTPRVYLSKHKVMQILVNLVSNAKHALDQTTGQRQITVQMALHEHEGQHQLIYRVVDTGCGIKPEDLDRIFNHGYTTRPEGRGYGLHYSILTATELGGSLTVKSPGPGRGATFTLILPVKVEGHLAGPKYQGMNI
jgi:C4-dicarboxylate-specific signal transduction histidine kinase